MNSVELKRRKKNYEKFMQAHKNANDTVMSAVSLDEASSIKDEVKKRETMEVYRKGIKEFETAIKLAELEMSSANSVEVRKLKGSMEKNLCSTKDRLVYLEEKLGVIRGRRHAPILERKKPTMAVTPSLSAPSTSRTLRKIPQARTASSIVGKSKLTRSTLLNGVDEKFGGPILDEILGAQGVKMCDIEGMDGAKKALEETVILPALNPSLFSGLRQPVQGILLFGPPGNGKTMLAKAVATECEGTLFINVSAASITSKWVGEAEKIVKTLFKIARNGQPAIIFIDEIDSILCERSEKETEVSRRMKTEFLIQLDGVSTSNLDRLLVIGATNRPDELDAAVLRRFPKRILVDVPDADARMSLITSLMKKNKTAFDLSTFQLRNLARETEGYSNSDLVSLCREAAMAPVRELGKSELKKITGSQLRAICMADFQLALKIVKPSVTDKVRMKLRKFAEDSGQIA